MTDLSDKLTTVWDHAIDRLPDAVLTLVVGLLVVEVSLWVLFSVLRFTRLRPALKRIIRALVRTFLFVVLFVAVIQSLGLNNIFVALTGSGVIAALLISTGVAPLVTDVLSGLFLGSDPDFQPGARIQAGDKQTEGVIETMDLRKVRVRDSSGKLHVIPNALIEKNEWVILQARKLRPRKRR